MASLVDLSKYRLLETEKSFCGFCSVEVAASGLSPVRVYLLCPRLLYDGLAEDTGKDAMFYLCARCGRISQSGVGEIAPAEDQL